jgi:hypothetical protein
MILYSFDDTGQRDQSIRLDTQLGCGTSDEFAIPEPKMLPFGFSAMTLWYESKVLKVTFDSKII